MTFENLFFRRQFLLTKRICNPLHHWPCKSFGKYKIYAHPDVELNIIESSNRDIRMALIGYIIDPHHPHRSNLDILKDMINSATLVDSISNCLYSLSGRFVLVVQNLEDTCIFHDPCGLRTVYYTNYKGDISIGSQPLILGFVRPLVKGDVFKHYSESEYVEKNIEHWKPSGYSFYEDIYHLVPNHYLQFSNFFQKRYWPQKKLLNRQLDEIVHDVSASLENLLQAANNRFKLALPLTAGLDSRTLLGACKNIAADIYFYTLQYRNLIMESNDIRIPNELINHLGFKHHVIDCRMVIDLKFKEIYAKNTPMSHIEDWGQIAYGMNVLYPPDRVCLKGNCSEICRCFYYPSGKHHPIRSLDKIIGLEPGWKKLKFIRDHLSVWFADAIIVQENTGVDILDLFYWEHRMGSWQAQSQLEWDIVQEAFTPFNHRGLLESMLGVSPEFRRAPNYILYKKICDTLWPEVMKYPINPWESVKDTAKYIFLRLGLEEKARRLYNYFRQ